jgi:hypothetical protein
LAALGGILRRNGRYSGSGGLRRSWTLKISGPAYDEPRARKMHRHVSDERVVSADRDFIDRQHN